MATSAKWAGCRASSSAAVSWEHTRAFFELKLLIMYAFMLAPWKNSEFQRLVAFCKNLGSMTSLAFQVSVTVSLAALGVVTNADRSFGIWRQALNWQASNNALVKERKSRFCPVLRGVWFCSCSQITSCMSSQLLCFHYLVLSPIFKILREFSLNWKAVVNMAKLRAPAQNSNLDPS